MDLNTYCILCTECVKSCPKDNVCFNLRPFCSDLIKNFTARIDEASLAIVLLGLTFFHGLTMTSIWPTLSNGLEDMMGLGYFSTFSILMLGITLIPAIAHSISSSMSKYLSRNRSIPWKTIFVNYAYSLLPVALFYHLAHNAQHLLREGQRLVPVLSDPFGLGWNLFGTAGWKLKPILSMVTIWYIQAILIVLGCFYGIYITQKSSRRLFNDLDQAFRAHLPMMILIVIFSILNLWLIKQPMEMKTFL